jgi:hypothetical protein
MRRSCPIVKYLGLLNNGMNSALIPNTPSPNLGEGELEVLLPLPNWERVGVRAATDSNGESILQAQRPISPAALLRAAQDLRELILMIVVEVAPSFLTLGTLLKLPQRLIDESPVV